MYPLNVTLPSGGYAVANDAAEHAALSAMGYLPALETPAPSVPDVPETDDQGHTLESVRAQLDALGVTYDKRLGLARLVALLP